MVTTTLTKLTQEFRTAFNSHDIEKIASLYNNDSSLEDVGTNLVFRGMKEIKQFYNNLFKAFPDAKMEFKSDFRSGDWSANEWVITATHKGTMPSTGIMPEFPATGKKLTWRGATIIRVSSDKVSQLTTYWNPASLLQQLGLIPSTPPK
jgi:steroid delta-isomerase-like uncharacterized protein